MPEQLLSSLIPKRISLFEKEGEIFFKEDEKGKFSIHNTETSTVDYRYFENFLDLPQCDLHPENIDQKEQHNP
ncbi:MAG: hypothetical protein C5B52_08220 [Bacteroidetes bacterium]|nr:MAG: hypothetical protein C5B52_08220 [Bacteroidota bacterium]